jgi:hypothetical protein
MPRRKPLSLEKQRHAVAKYLRLLNAKLVDRSHRLKYRFSPMDIGVAPNGVGHILVPSRLSFEKVGPNSLPIGLVFPDGSFLCFKEIVRFDYRDDAATEPSVFCLSYSFHYQRPGDLYFFRYDHHPEVGLDECHPLHHLHVAHWHEGATTLPESPRFTVPETPLDQVLHVIEHHFL